MKQYLNIALALSLSGLAFSSAALADEMVNTYANSSDGTPVTTTRGDCLRTTRQDSTDKRVECGYKVEKSIEVVKTPTAVSVTAKVDKEIVIAAGILFEFDSDALSSDGKAIILERIARFGGKANNVEIEVIGHTDSTGPEDYNQGLSERRAHSVGSFIEQMKESPDAKVEVSGVGESQPIASNDTKEGRATNRRVKIIVTGTVTE